MKKKQNSRKTYKRRVFFRRFGKLLHRIVVMLAVLGFVLAFYRIFFSSKFFSITDVQIYGTQTFVSKNDMKSVVKDSSYKKNIFKFNTSLLATRLKESFQGAKTIKIKKKLPNKLVVQVIERVPLAVISNPGSDKYFMVDKDGYVLGIVDIATTNLPQISYTGDLNVGMFIDPLLVPLYLDLLNSLDVEKLKASTVSVNDKSINFFLDDSVFVLVGREKNIHKSVKIVSKLLQQLKVEGKNVSKIDLRYDKVVVEY